jgi:Na+/proline symporter
MTVNTPPLVTFSGDLLLMVGIGFRAWRSTRNFNHYVLGGRLPGSFVTALSARLPHDRMAADGRKRLNRYGALAGMVVGGATIIVWKQYAASGLYEMVPGMLAATAVIVVVGLLTGVPTARMQTTNQQVRQILREQGH